MLQLVGLRLNAPLVRLFGAPLTALLRRKPMRILMMLSLAALLAACQPNSRSANAPTSCGPGGMGCPQGPMPYGDIDGAVGGSSPN